MIAELSIGAPPKERRPNLSDGDRSVDPPPEFKR